MGNDLLLVKVLGAKVGSVFNVRAVAELIYDAKPSECGMFMPWIELCHKRHAEAVAAHCAKNGLSGPEALNREGFIEILIQLLPVLIQLLPVICPT